MRSNPRHRHRGFPKDQATPEVSRSYEEPTEKVLLHPMVDRTNGQIRRMGCLLDLAKW